MMETFASFKDTESAFNDYIQFLKDQPYESALVVDSLTGKYSVEHIREAINNPSTFVIGIGDIVNKFSFDCQITNRALDRAFATTVQIDESQFSKQYQFWRKRKNISHWNNGLFHLNIDLIGAIHLCYLVGLKQIRLANVKINTKIHRPFDSKILLQFLTLLVLKKSVRVEYTEKDNVILSKISKISCVDVDDVADKSKVGRTSAKSSFQPSFGKSKYIELLNKKSKVFANAHVPILDESLRTCALVGNSQQLLNANHGSKIDGYDFVVRFNGAPSKGYESHVGTKADLRFLKEKLVCQRSLTTWDRKWFNSLEGENLLLEAADQRKMIEATKLLCNSNRLFFLSDAANMQIDNFCSSHDIPKPSSGLQMIITMSNFFDQIDLFGFTPFDVSERSYWEANSSYRTIHDSHLRMRSEWSILDKMKSKGMISVT